MCPSRAEYFPAMGVTTPKPSSRVPTNVQLDGALTSVVKDSVAPSGMVHANVPTASETTTEVSLSFRTMVCRKLGRGK